MNGTTTMPTVIGNGTTTLGNVHPLKGVIVDAVFANDSLISSNWSALSLGCLTWKPPNHTLFQVSAALLSSQNIHVIFKYC